METDCDRKKELSSIKYLVAYLTMAAHLFVSFIKWLRSLSKSKMNGSKNSDSIPLKSIAS